MAFRAPSERHGVRSLYLPQFSITTLAKYRRFFAGRHLDGARSVRCAPSFLRRRFARQLRPGIPAIFPGKGAVRHRQPPPAWARMNAMHDASLARHWFTHARHTAIGMGGNAKAQRASPGEKAGPQPKDPGQTTRLLRVNVLAGCETAWNSAAERLVRHLNADPQLIAESIVHDNPASLISHLSSLIPDPSSEDYDCLVLLGWPAADDRRRLKQIELYCRGGGPLVAVRTLDAVMPGWPTWRKRCLVVGSRVRGEAGCWKSCGRRWPGTTPWWTVWKSCLRRGKFIAVPGFRRGRPSF